MTYDLYILSNTVDGALRIDCSLKLFFNSHSSFHFPTPSLKEEKTEREEAPFIAVLSWVLDH
jgi:hypothetical protein